jgi:glycerophosphoryl diester phosphodiesterase
MNFPWLLKVPIAHRGLHNIRNCIPENSIPAFELAIEKNYPIELDVQIIKDGTVIVFHDTSLERIAKVKRPVSSLTQDDIKKIYLMDTNEKIPTLKRVLAKVAGKVPLLIEIKKQIFSSNIEKYVSELLQNYNGEFAIQSFNPYTVFWFKKNCPQMIRGQITPEFSSEKLSYLAKSILVNEIFHKITEPDFLAVDVNSLPNKRVIEMKKNDIPLICWTVKNLSHYIKAKKYCDNFIFEGIDITAAEKN